MIVEKLVISDTNDMNSYLVACPETGQAMIIDPGSYHPRMAEWLAENGLTLAMIFLTHAHGDHTGGIPELKRQWPDAELVMGADEPPNVPVRPDRLVEGGDELRIGKLVGRLYDTPGHTPGGLTLHLGGCAFTGDALFSGSVGGTGSEETFDQQNAAVAERVLRLPDDTVVHPGHGPSSTVGAERRFNSFFVP